jgi:hypothetical protein
MKQLKYNVVLAGTFFALFLLGGGGCAPQTKTPEPPAQITSTPARDQSMKIFSNTTGGLSFEYPGTWLYDVQDREDMFYVEFYQNEQDKKGNVPILSFSTPHPETGFEAMEVVKSQKYPTNGGKGHIDYAYLKVCVEEVVGKPCKTQKGGELVASWSRDDKFKLKEGEDIKHLKYQSGQFLMYLDFLKNDAEEKKMVAVFDKIIKSLKFTEAQGKSLQEYLDTSDKLISSGSALSEDKVLSLASLVEAFVVDTSTSCGDNWEDEFCDPKTRKWLSESAVLTDKNWKDGKDHTFYFKSTKSETRDLYLGPFKDNIVRLREEAVKSKILLPSGSR